MPEKYMLKKHWPIIPAIAIRIRRVLFVTEEFDIVVQLNIYFPGACIHWMKHVKVKLI